MEKKGIEYHTEEGECCAGVLDLFLRQRNT